MKIVSYQKIADSLGISKQAVDKLFVRKGYLKKNNNGKIDIDDQDNRNFLIEKGANFRFFGESRKQKTIQTPPKMPEKPDIRPQKPPENDTSESGQLVKLDKLLKIERIKASQRNTELKTLQIQEMRGELIPKKIVDQLIEDFFGRFNEMLLNKPKSIANDILTEAKTGTLNDVIRLMQKSYMEENKKLLDNAMKRYIDAIDAKIKEAENDPRIAV
jgi:hypothetical protein